MEQVNQSLLEGMRKWKEAYKADLVQKGTKLTVRSKRKRKDTNENGDFLVHKRSIDMTKIIQPGTMEVEELDQGGV